MNSHGKPGNAQSGKLLMKINALDLLQGGCSCNWSGHSHEQEAHQLLLQALDSWFLEHIFAG